MRKLNRVVAVIGAALVVGLLALGTVTVAGPPGPPGPPPKPEPPGAPKILPDDIIDGVNQLLPDVKLQKVQHNKNNHVYRTLGGASRPAPNVIPGRGEIRLFDKVDENLRKNPPPTLLGQQAGGALVGDMELAREYKLGGEALAKGRYHIAAWYDPGNKILGIDPENKTDFYLTLARDANGNGEIEVEEVLDVTVGLPHRALARVMERFVDERTQVEFAVYVLLNLLVKLLEP